MDAKRFDAIAKTLIGETTRRRALGGLLGGLIGAISLADPEDATAARSGRCKPDCGQCERCDKGACRKKNGKKRCKKGKCKPLTGTTCNGTGTCQSGVCTCPPGSQACGGACVAGCLGPTRGLNPLTCTCCGTGGDPVTCVGGANAACCTGSCDIVGQVCVSRSPGAACEFGAQCASGVCGGNGLCTPV